MPVSHRLSDGSELVLHIRCNTRRNIILRPHPAGGLHIGIPRWRGITERRRWLQEHEPLLRQTLARAPDSPKQPESIWLDGERLALAGGSGVPAIRRDGSRLLLPDTADIRALLRGYLREQAPDLLFPLFAERLSSLKLPATPVRLMPAASGACADPAASVSTGGSPARPPGCATMCACTNCVISATPTTAAPSGRKSPATPRTPPPPKAGSKPTAANFSPAARQPESSQNGFSGCPSAQTKVFRLLSPRLALNAGSRFPYNPRFAAAAPFFRFC